MNNKFYLQELQATLLEILDVIAEICEKNQLTYFLAYGSCLGAIRHRGFIPWDDDMDIGMPRKDYEKFIELCSTELPEGYYFQSIENEKHYWLPFGKVRKKGTLFVEDYIDKKLFSEEQQGIWVDIFPYEGICGTEVKNLRYNYIIRKIRVLLFFKIHKKLLNKKECFKQLVAKMIPWKISHNLMVFFINKMNVKDPDTYASIAQGQEFTSGMIEVMDGKIPVMKAKFEDREYNVLCDYDKYLQELYGDYLKLPPVEMRRTHMPVKIDFGKKI